MILADFAYPVYDLCFAPMDYEIIKLSNRSTLNVSDQGSSRNTSFTIGYLRFYFYVSK